MSVEHGPSRSARQACDHCGEFHLDENLELVRHDQMLCATCAESAREKQAEDDAGDYYGGDSVGSYGPSRRGEQR